MSHEDDAADALAKMVPVGVDHPRAQELGDALLDELAGRVPPNGNVDPAVLHQLAQAKEGELLELTEARMSSLYVTVDYLDLVEAVGEDEAWVVLGKLKDLLDEPETVMTFLRAYPTEFQLQPSSRTLTGRLVPYDVAAPVMDRENGVIDIYQEGFRRGAFSAQLNDPGRIKGIKLRHSHGGDGLGFLGPFVGLREEAGDGLWGDVRVLPTKVDDVASLLDSGVDELSIEFGLRKGSNTIVDDAGVRWRTAVHLYGVALEAKGAYTGAAVMAFRSEMDEQQREEAEKLAAEQAEAKRVADLEDAKKAADREADERRKRWQELEHETDEKQRQQAELMAKYGG